MPQNASQRSRVRTAVKSVRKAIAAGDKNSALESLSNAASMIDSIADKKVIHKNTAARNKSRLAAAIKAMAELLGQPPADPLCCSAPRHAFAADTAIGQ